LILQRRLTDEDKDKPRLFTFLKYPNLQPTNNQAERSLRGMVIFRKICMGTRSAGGSYTHSVLPSLLVAAQRQGRHPLGFLKRCSAQRPKPPRRLFTTIPPDPSIHHRRWPYETFAQLRYQALAFPTENRGFISQKSKITI